ncbi:hypothetical protein N7540_003715 [Penicillium herquei]|nr:hypothetical protein N7540_003715 [Penicillium herquei]
MPRSHYTRQYKHGIIALSVSLSSLATILMILRYYTYFFVVRHKSGWALTWATVGWTHNNFHATSDDS